MSQKTAILSDIHGNLEALEAVFNNFKKYKPDQVVVLGDSIGYGPNPGECLEKAYNSADVFLIGNHCADLIQPDPYMGADTKEILAWTENQITDLPEWQKIQKQTEGFGLEKLAHKLENGCEFTHATPKRPVTQYLWPAHESQYIIYNDQIDERLKEFMDEFTELHGFNGHTHQPAILAEYKDRMIFEFVDWNRKATFLGPNTVFFVPEGNAVIKGIAGKKLIMNPGSVGQPRDGVPMASYGLYDGNNFVIKRVPYDLRKTQEKIKGMPVSDDIKEGLVKRLEKGE